MKTKALILCALSRLWPRSQRLQAAKTPPPAGRVSMRLGFGSQRRDRRANGPGARLDLTSGAAGTFTARHHANPLVGPQDGDEWTTLSLWTAISPPEKQPRKL